MEVMLVSYEERTRNQERVSTSWEFWRDPLCPQRHGQRQRLVRHSQ
jgi:hypothetical protein